MVPIARTVTTFGSSYVTINYCKFCFYPESYKNCFLCLVVVVVMPLFFIRAVLAKMSATLLKSGPDSWVKPLGVP